MKKLILYVIISLNIFSLTELEKKLINEIENMHYECDISKQETIKIKGKNFVGNINNKGELYGELYFTNFPDLKYCILEDEYKEYSISDKTLYLSKENLEDGNIIKYENLYQYLVNGSVYVFKRENGKFNRIYGVIVIKPKTYFSRGGKNKKDFFRKNKLKINEKEIE